MNVRTHLLAAGATAALLVTPAVGLAAGPPSDPGAGHRPATQPTATSNPGTANRPSTPGPNASAKAKAKAYGSSCAGQSKKHVAGETGTAFSRCVTAMAKVAGSDSVSPKAACKGLSKKHVKGEKGTAFSRCVVAAAKLQQATSSTDSTDTTDTTGTTGTTDGTSTPVAPTTDPTAPTTDPTAPATV